MCKYIILTISTVILLQGFVSGEKWGYTGDKGASNWGKLFSDCGSTSQSPINIVTTNVQTNTSLGTFPRELFYAKPSEMVLLNNGHSAEVGITGGYTISDQTLLPGAFKLEQFHFHWGSGSRNGGSEHTVDGVQYFGEMHAVFYNTKYADISTAAAESDGLAVLGFFIEPSYLQDNCAFNRIIEKLGSITTQNQTRRFNSTEIASLETLFPADISKYYRYSGSLTTPPCFESVVWTVFKSPILISTNQATQLATLLKKGDGSSATLAANYRSVQSLNGRTVYQNSSKGKVASLFITTILVIFGCVMIS